jgi:hypothetical protein
MVPPEGSGSDNRGKSLFYGEIPYIIKPIQILTICRPAHNRGFLPLLSGHNREDFPGYRVITAADGIHWIHDVKERSGSSASGQEPAGYTISVYKIPRKF